ncbi:molybdenum cofactor guanylyltransferase MobA [Ferrimonas senticii]|uniref:molybdenum cofactor guanylyltransferase MobA n=1 Tax=Ferrimonas senticii TaxID=394566 RepID=UPI0004214642|nr:molybdenum cofactor guanylyltransferase MobA [Ferrimonas senticii]
MNQLTLAVLAGGQAQRMGGQDKGLIDVAGQPMVQHVLQRLDAEQLPTLLISNRNQDQYRQLGYPVYSDNIPGFAGPLAGVCRALEAATTDYVLVVPCDTPRLPTDLAERMFTHLQQQDAEVVIARDEQQDHPIVMLLQRNLLGSLQQFLDAGERKVIFWCQQHRMSYCLFDGQSAAFANINTPEQKQQLEAELLGDNR